MVRKQEVADKLHKGDVWNPNGHVARKKTLWPAQVHPHAIKTPKPIKDRTPVDEIHEVIYEGPAPK